MTLLSRLWLLILSWLEPIPLQCEMCGGFVSGAGKLDHLGYCRKCGWEPDEYGATEGGRAA